MPAALAVRCPECGKGLKLPAAAAGKAAKCPGCGGRVKVPGGGPAPKPEAKADGETSEFLAALPKAKAPKALPGRVGGGPSTSDMPVYDDAAQGKRKEPTSPVVIAASLGGGLLVVLLAAGGLAYLLYTSEPAGPPPGAAQEAPTVAPPSR